ncbi:hypothetical protein [Cellulomonas sp. ES6]|uniref:hypothetical protein n=1 Tax=Cellulomonas sp. ES6 TaxID=3039384 RepID=UPI0024B758AB|nr:hypothetical protein [Cellulomonas sp. ES6]WHP18816.1 hypothetical protein P9841_06785 [Cellulomonas sp. ES6]
MTSSEHFDWCDVGACEVVATSPERLVAHRTRAVEVIPGVTLRASRTRAEWTESEGPIDLTLTTAGTFTAEQLHDLGAELCNNRPTDRLIDSMLSHPRPTACPEWCTADADQPGWRGHRWHYVGAHGCLIRVHAGRVGKTMRHQGEFAEPDSSTRLGPRRWIRD